MRLLYAHCTQKSIAQLECLFWYSTDDSTLNATFIRSSQDLEETIVTPVALRNIL
jgi:hypothetical protein